MKNIIIITLALLLILAGCNNDPAMAPVETTSPVPPSSSSVPVETAPEPVVQEPAVLPGVTVIPPSAVPESVPEPSIEPQLPEKQVVTFLAVGDNILHNTVLDSGKKSDGSYDYREFYEDISHVISAADLAAVNQECPLVYDPSLYSTYPEFGCPTAIGDALVDAGFDIVTMATNHVCDKGDTGILDSVDYFRTNYPDIALLGIRDSETSPVSYVEKNGITIAMLNYTYGYNGYGPSKSWMADALGDEAAIASRMEEAESNADCTIVFLHAGTEYVHEPDSSQQRWFSFFAEHGADAIIGTHPHVLQPMETITAFDGRDVPVWWSLGNFLSHQMDAARWLGGMAVFDIVKENGLVTIQNPELVPTFTYIYYEGARCCFRSLLLEDMTDEMADNSYYKSYYGNVDALWDMYNRIIENKN